MRCHAPKLALVMLCGIAALAGCAPQQPLYLRNSDDFSHYLGMSQTIDNADVPEPPFSELEGTIAPFRWGTGPQELLAPEAGRYHSLCPGKRQGDAADRRAGPRPAHVPYVEPRRGAHDLRSGDHGNRRAFRRQRRPLALRPAVEHGPFLGAESRAAERKPPLRQQLADRVGARHGPVRQFDQQDHAQRHDAHGKHFHGVRPRARQPDGESRRVARLYDFLPDGNPPALVAGLRRGVQRHRRPRRHPRL